jgi:hypothetical protein
LIATKFTDTVTSLVIVMVQVGLSEQPPPVQVPKPELPKDVAVSVTP